MSNENTQPDYVYWCKYDEWKFKQAALLLHNLDPSKYKEAAFNAKAPPEAEELQEPYKIYLLLRQYDAFKHQNGAHPFDIFRFTEKKEFPIPEELKSEILKRHAKETQPKRSQLLDNITAVPNKELGTRERNVFLKAVALMSCMLAARSQRHQVAGRPNPFQIAQDILGAAEDLGIDISGLKSFNRKITEALGFLKKEQEKEPEF